MSDGLGQFLCCPCMVFEECTGLDILDEMFGSGDSKGTKDTKDTRAAKPPARSGHSDRSIYVLNPTTSAPMMRF